MSKYSDMVDFYHGYAERLEKDADHWRERYIDACGKLSSANGKIEAYEEILNKVLGDKNTKTDEFVIFEGKVYGITDFVLERCNEDPRDTLILTCTKINLKKEENND